MEQNPLKVLPELPLFQGLGQKELDIFVSTIPYRVVTFKEGEYIVKQNNPCRELILPYKGNVIMETHSDNNRFVFHERLQTPFVMQLDSLYGIYTRYTHSFKAQTETKAIVLPKESVTQLFGLYDIFRINVINMLATKIHKQRKWLWKENDNNTIINFIRFIFLHSNYPAGEKIINITINDLAEQTKEARQNIRKALLELEKKNLVLLKRSNIIIPAFEKILQEYQI